MINSRDINDLAPRVRDKASLFKERCASQGIDILITSTFRDAESQDALYAQGRTAPGKIVTKVQGGYSFHNHGVAFDVVPVVNGKAIWDDLVLWNRIGALGVSCGLEWGGNWERWKDKPHFQDTNGFTIHDYIKGIAT